jgi:hypothetical protein
MTDIDYFLLIAVKSINILIVDEFIYWSVLYAYLEYHFII